jgi:hypothetical protein
MKKFGSRTGGVMHILRVAGVCLVVGCGKRVWSQCNPAEVAWHMNVFTDSWGYETYWELVPAGNACGVGTLAWGSNQATVGCSGAGEQNADGSGYPSNVVIETPPVCLTVGQGYTLIFVDDWGDGGLVFETFEAGSLTGWYTGTGTGNTWDFVAGFSALPAHDSPCNAAEILAGTAQAIALDNRNCVVQSAELEPALGETCQAQGIWCDGGATRTVWAHWVVPDEGHYAISTCHHGTQVDTQIAVWAGAACDDWESFELVSANDDAFGGCEAPACVAPPACVDVASWAYARVIDALPGCCNMAWDGACQSAYDGYLADCAAAAEGCHYVLQGHDSYGDGWNGCAVSWKVNGVDQTLTFTSGHEAQWELPVSPGDALEVTWIPGDWVEEASFTLYDAFGNVLYASVAGPPAGLLYAGDAVCQMGFGAHPQAARCTVGCLPAGTSCWIQIDGHGDEAGPLVLTIHPIAPGETIVAQVTPAVCPGGLGLPAEGGILPILPGWGINFDATWTGPDGFASTEQFLPHVAPGVYHLVATDDCGAQLEVEFEVPGPAPFHFENTIVPPCAGPASGEAAVQVSGGTAPYALSWTHPDGTQSTGTSASGLALGLHLVQVTDALGCSLIQGITMGAEWLPAFSWSDTLWTCLGDELWLDAPVAGTYVWSDGTTGASLQLSSSDWGVGFHAVGLTVYNDDGCWFADTLAWGVEVCAGAASGTFERQGFVFPNPAVASIQWSTTGPLSEARALEMFALDGRLVACWDAAVCRSGRLARGDWPDGVYVLQWSLPEGVKTERIQWWGM